MKKQIKQAFILIALILGIWLVSSNFTFASSDFTLKKINFDVQLLEDGSMEVVETWNLKVHSMTNTLFKTFNIDSSKYKEITDVQVSEQLGTNENVQFTQKNVEVNHVDKNCYYALVNSKGKYEIAWGINEKSGEKTYQIKYKVVDAIKNYSDCSELYWQFIGKDFEVDVDQVTGSIRIPAGEVDKEEVRAWAHGPLNGNISINNVDKSVQVDFEIAYLDSENYVEVRMAMPTRLFLTNVNTVSQERLQTILSEETTWANEANQLREKKRAEKEARDRNYQIFKNVLSIIIAIGIVFLLTKISKYQKSLKENPQKQPSVQYEYFRDIPKEDASPAQAAFLYYFGGATFKQNLPKILSATMLNLCMKQYLSFRSVEKKLGKQDIEVQIEQGSKELTKDEKIIYELLKKVAGNSTSFTMKDLEKYAKKNNESFLGKLEGIEGVVKQEEEKQQNYDSNNRKTGDKWQAKAGEYVFLTIISIVLIFVLDLKIIPIAFTALSVVCAIMAGRVAGRFNGLTQNGADEKAKWVGLKKYMEDFSMIEDKTVPELILWEKYLVFATAFGIADKVLKQLKVVYPQLSEDDFDQGTYLSLMYYSGFNHSFIHSLEHSVNSAYEGGVSARASSYAYGNTSSGGGFGGGFSGGGGFGGGGRRWRRSLKLVK